MHRHGVPSTTLAQVADAADVPLGNVYYYFKTKDDLIRGVIEDRNRGVNALLATFDQRRSPAARLKAMARHWGEMSELIARHGCPIGSLSAELSRRDDGLDHEGAEALRLLRDWAEVQFRELGRRDAPELAVTLLAGVQGAALLANTFRDPALMTGQVRGLERWIDSLA